MSPSRRMACRPAPRRTGRGGGMSLPLRRRIRACARFLRGAYGFASLFLPRPSEVYNARRTLANLAGPLRRALAERRWDAFVIIQSSFAEWLDWLPAIRRPSSCCTTSGPWSGAGSFKSRPGWRGSSARWSRPLNIGPTRAIIFAARRRHLPDRGQRSTGASVGSASPSLAVVPLPVDTRLLPPHAARGGGPCPLLFPGMMDHYPNIDAALWFVRGSYPRLRRAHPEVLLVVAGMRPPREITGARRTRRHQGDGRGAGHAALLPGGERGGGAASHRQRRAQQDSRSLGLRPPRGVDDGRRRGPGFCGWPRSQPCGRRRRLCRRGRRTPGAGRAARGAGRGRLCRRARPCPGARRRTLPRGSRGRGPEAAGRGPRIPCGLPSTCVG